MQVKINVRNQKRPLLRYIFSGCILLILIGVGLVYTLDFTPSPELIIVPVDLDAS